MQSIPQLRVRSECSFRKTFGTVERVAQSLKDSGQTFAGLVDADGTWGHVRWRKALKDSGVTAAYGTEFQIPDESGKKPSCWVLAEDIKQFYRLSSANPTTQEELAAAKGVIRFAGAALTDPDAFDYIDLNPASILASKRSLDLHRATGKPLVLTSDCDYPEPGLQSEFMAWVDNAKLTPQHILTPPEFREAFWFLPDDVYNKALSNTHEAAERVGAVDLPFAPIIQVPGHLPSLVEEGKAYRLAAGHLEEWNEVYQQRLERELAMIEQKQFESYFLVVADLVVWAKQRMLVGPARGSSAGSLVCYLLRITEVDPIPTGLLFERFIDINRDDLPDIDIDFNDQKRYMVFDYLAEKYGADNVSRIGSLSTLKPRSVMAHVAKKLSIPHGATFSVLNVLIEYSSGDARYGKGLEDTLENTQPGRDFIKRYPEASLMGTLENHASHTGVHAAGIIVANVPVVEHCTVRNGVAHIDKKDAEVLNLLKIDALGLRTLGVIEDTGCITPEQLFALKLDDPEVFEVFNQAKFSGLFQFEGAAQRRVSIQVPIKSFKQIDHVTALARPGPLGGGAANHYINRNIGKEPVTYRHPSMADYLAETMGVVLYQEQVMRIVRELGRFSWEETSTIRKAMSGRKGKEFFDRRGEQFAEGAATHGISAEQAAEIWHEICSFGAWGMNASHTCSYAVISYWCAYMKRYHPLEYAAACLRNAKDEEQVIEILRELTAEGIPYQPFDAQLSDVNWGTKEGRLLGGFTNLKGIGPVKAKAYVERRAAKGLTEKDLAQIAKHEVKHKELRPAHAMWNHIYSDPDSHNIKGRVREFADLEDFEEGVVICRLIRKERRDDNETVRVARRNGERKPGQTLFLDVFAVDDSVSKPVVIRVKANQWFEVGEVLADKAVDGKDWFLIRGKWLKQFSMMTVHKIKCLTNPEMFT
jgi:DNA polymerase III alpha subunit